MASSGATATSSHVQIRCEPCIDVDGVAKAPGNCPTSQGRGSTGTQCSQCCLPSRSAQVLEAPPSWKRNDHQLVFVLPRGKPTATKKWLQASFWEAKRRQTHTNTTKWRSKFPRFCPGICTARLEVQTVLMCSSDSLHVKKSICILSQQPFHVAQTFLQAFACRMYGGNSPNMLAESCQNQHVRPGMWLFKGCRVREGRRSFSKNGWRCTCPRGSGMGRGQASQFIFRPILLHVMEH